MSDFLLLGNSANFVSWLLGFIVGFGFIVEGWGKITSPSGAGWAAVSGVANYILYLLNTDPGDKPVNWFLYGVASSTIIVTILFSAFVFCFWRTGEARDKTAILAVFKFLFLGIRGFLTSELSSKSEEETRRSIMDNCCVQIFKNLNLDSTYRVSILQMKEGYLEVIGRYSEFESMKKSRVRFQSNKGSAGIAYNTGAKHVVDDLPSFEESPEKYYERSKECCNMLKEDVDKLHRKNRSYLSIPIRYFNVHEFVGVLVVDSSSPNAFSKNELLVGQIEEQTPWVSMLFNK